MVTLQFDGYTVTLASEEEAKEFLQEMELQEWTPEMQREYKADMSQSFYDQYYEE